MKFRTEIDIQPLPFTVGYARRGLFAGSCFAQQMAAQMRRAGLQVTVNPYGVLFNPLSLASMLEALAAGRSYTEADLERASDGRRFSYRFHGDFAASTPEEALEKMNRATKTGAAALREAHYVVITFGTARVWELRERGYAVANCHRQPAALFRSRMTQPEEIVARWDALMQGPLQGKRVIFTLSPVRHLGCGAADNTLSKATLALAIHSLCARHRAACYFPAYELLCDELRDYRFYAPDMVHPSPQAIGYIWERFAAALLDEQARAIAPLAERIADAAAHRPADPSSQRYRDFCRATLSQARQLRQRCPHIDMHEAEEVLRAGAGEEEK